MPAVDGSAMQVEEKWLTPAKRGADAIGDEEMPQASSSQPPALTGPGGAPLSAGAAEVQRFLSSIGLSRYFPKLVKAGFDSMEALRAMEEEDMKQECGMLAGHIRLLQKHLGRRQVEGGEDSKVRADRDRLRRPTARANEALANFGCTGGAGVPVSELLSRAMAELRQLRPASAAAAEGAAAAAKAAASAPPQPEKRREPRPPKPPPGPADEAAKKERIAQEERRQLEIARAEMASQFDEKYMAAMQAAQAMLNADPDLPGADDTLASLAQLAEGSAQLVATAASLCANPQVDPHVLAAVVDAAQQGAQRASWAAVAAVAYGDSDDFGKEWNQKMRRAAVQAAEVAEQYARDCAAAAKMVGKGQVVQRAFCKFHAENRCLKGTSCEFSHDPSVLAPLPLASKTELECVFFSKGQCTRGAGCPFAHGPEELNEIIRLKSGPS